MSDSLLYLNEFQITIALVRKLLNEQFPQWTELSIHPIEPPGTDNVMFCLGDDKVIRFPRTIEKEAPLRLEMEWLPVLSNEMTMSIPNVIAVGQPTKEYPCHWWVGNLLPGAHVTLKNPLTQEGAAKDLARFIMEMRQLDTHQAPSCYRGLPLETKHEETVSAIHQLKDRYDIALMESIWNESLAAKPWQEAPVWIHGDLHPGNILAKNGKITAIIDFGLAGIGDPACDLMVAWTLLDERSRLPFKELLQPDNETWLRARGWAFTFGAVAYPYYQDRLPSLAEIAKNTLDKVISCDLS